MDKKRIIFYSKNTLNGAVWGKAGNRKKSPIVANTHFLLSLGITNYLLYTYCKKYKVDIKRSVNEQNLYYLDKVLDVYNSRTSNNLSYEVIKLEDDSSEIVFQNS
ncbi:hypothetical protein L0991_03630 [Vibrio chagasii]|uniref:hypothetical protein n=1 Tax=Vibrio chagasii TaxID=170679 RepID=UPI0035A670A1